MKSKFANIGRVALATASLACSLIAPGVVRSSNNSTFSVKPAPVWIEPAATPASETDFTKNSGSGAACLLFDKQTRVTASGVERYYRRVDKALNIAGLDDISQLELEFEPSYQQLVIHHIQIRRGETVINALVPSEIKLIQKESELNQKLYNGTMSAVAFLSDVRVGDVVDYAYSVNGDNPVLDGKYTDKVALVAEVPVATLRWRLLFPNSRSVHYRSRNADVQPSVEKSGEFTEYNWERKQVAKLQFEADAPSWFNQVPMIELSEFADWGEVVRWASPLYKVNRPLSTSLSTQIERWRSQSGEPEKRLLAALRFVQDEVRYTGIELGSYSHTPTQPSVVCERRFGDCKDKSLLLVTALNEMGIEARPALVDTDLRQTVADEEPSPYAFNHVIVRAALNGNVYWLDPTISLQRGGLDEHQNPAYGRALVIRDGSTDLEEIPLNEEGKPTTELKEVYTVSGDPGRGSLEVMTTYHGPDADAIRYRLAQQSLTEIEKENERYYAQIDPAIESLGAPEVRDDQESNTVVVTERYTIPAFWNEGHREFYAGQISEQISRTAAASRKAPLALGYPSFISETIEARFPEHFSIKSDSGRVATDSLDFRYSFSSSGNVVSLAYQLRLLKDHVSSEQMTRHLDAVDKIQRVLAYEITSGSSERADGGTGLGYLPLLIVFGPFVIFGAIKVINNRRLGARRSDFKQRLQASPGDTPATSVLVNSPDEFRGHLLGFKCACGASYSLPEGEIEYERLIYAGRRVSVVSLKCERCARPRDFYFSLRNQIENH